MVENGKKIPIPIGKTLRQFVIKIVMDLCIAKILTAFICDSMVEKTLYILARKETLIYVVPVEFLTLVRQGSVQLLREIQHMFFMLDHIFAYQKMYVSDPQKM